MNWFQVLLIILSSTGTSIAILLHLSTKLDKISSDINKDMRDFHGRLCKIEERRK